MDIKYVITDIDGVWTDGGMFYSESGEEFKKFNTSDSVGVLILKDLGIPMAIITGENSNAVKKRAEKLKVTNCYVGVVKKLELAKQIAAEEKISLGNMAFIGDEINDHELLNEVGFSACPKSAPDYTKKMVDFIVPTEGGKGAFRDFILEILRRTDREVEKYQHLL